MIACLTYVDLNPIKAGMAQTPETSEYTLIKDRAEMPKGLPFNLKEYL